MKFTDKISKVPFVLVQKKPFWPKEFLKFMQGFKLGFATGRDSATFRDKGTEIPSLSRDKGTTGQAQNLATGRNGTGF